MTSKVSVVIPYYNHWDLTHEVLFCLYNYCREDIYEVVVVNDGSTEESSYTGLSWWKKSKMLPIKILEMEENVGFLRAANAGMRKASGDIVVLLSNDVVIHENIIKKIEYQLRNMERCLVGGKIYEVDTGWNTFGSVTFPYLEGWLLATWKSIWEELQYFDERYAPNDYEDIDLSTMAIDRGITLVSLEGSKITHLSGRSIGYSAERAELTTENKKKFGEKWNKLM